MLARLLFPTAYFARPKRHPRARSLARFCPEDRLHQIVVYMLDNCNALSEHGHSVAAFDSPLLRSPGIPSTASL
jgi:hypothetical protein